MSRRRQLAEVILGRGDYAAGGACTEPFLEQDGARRRRPMVLGEVLCHDPEDPLVRSMFSGRTSNPGDWAMMWREIGADGVCVRIESPDDSMVVAAVAIRTGLPVAVSGPREAVDACVDIDGTVLILMDASPGDDGHVRATTFGSEVSEGPNRMHLVTGRFPEPDAFSEAASIRDRALDGDAYCDAPIAFDVTPVWDEGFADERGASMMEGEAVLAAMLSGADLLIVRGPGAADMARVYGEELADL